MGKVLIIGAGGVGTVVAHKVAQNPDVFTEIMIASRTKSKCDAVVKAIGNPSGRCRHCRRTGGALQQFQTRNRHKRSSPLSGPYYHGSLSEKRSKLSGYGQLRTERRRSLRIQLAMGIQKAL